MALNVLYVGNEHQTSLGTVASLALLKNNVLYLDVTLNSRKRKFIEFSNRTVSLFNNLKVTIKHAIASIPSISISQVRKLYEVILKTEFKPDIVISRGAKTFYIGYLLSGLFKTPIVLYVASIRGLKFPAHVVYGKQYSEILRAPLSLLHHYTMINLSNATIFSEWFSYKVYKKVVPHKKLYVVESTFTDKILESEDRSYNKIIPIITSEPYMLSIVSGKRLRSGSRIELLQLKVIVYTALKVPNVKFIVVGCNPKDVLLWKTALRYKLPPNVILAGWITGSPLRSLYEKAYGVVNPILLRAQSNRFLEAMFHGKAIITTSACTFFYKNLKHLEHIIIEDDFTRYPYWVKRVVYSEILRKKLEKGAKNYFAKYHSPLRHGTLIQKILKEVIGEYQ